MLKPLKNLHLPTSILHVEVWYTREIQGQDQPQRAGLLLVYAKRLLLRVFWGNSYTSSVWRLPFLACFALFSAEVSQIQTWLRVEWSTLIIWVHGMGAVMLLWVTKSLNLFPVKGSGTLCWILLLTLLDHCFWRFTERNWGFSFSRWVSMQRRFSEPKKWF